MIKVQPTPLPLPKGYKAPSTTQGMIEEIAKYTKYVISADTQIMVVGPNTPDILDQGRVWLRTDTFGRPVGFFLWFGASWRKVPVPRPFEIRMFNGPPSSYFDGTGLGLPTAEWDGWALCNGQNQTPDLRDKFIVVTPVANQQLITGGAASLTIALNQLPAITGTVGELYDFQFGGGLLGWSGLHFGGGAATRVQVTAVNTGAGTPISTLPPFVAVGFAQWVGYK